MQAARDAKGRFLPNHPWAAQGGRARAKALTPQRRKQIARLGFLGLVAKRFEGDRDAACEWLAAKGRAATDAHYEPRLRKFFDPGPMPSPQQEVIF